MTFWGAEVKPREPVTVYCEKLRGKLILTQATLGKGSSNEKSRLRCTTRFKNPVFLCTLLPENSESCSLNLEFDGEDVVIFSIAGPTSIHLAGFVQQVSRDLDGKGYGSDAYEESSDYDSVDDDDDVAMYPLSPVSNSGVVIKEIADDKKDSGEFRTSKQSKKKKNELVDTNNDQKMDDAKHKRNKAKTDSKNDEDDKSVKRKIDAVDHSEEPKSDAVADEKKAKKKQKGKTDDGEADDDTKKTPTTDTKQFNVKLAKIRTYDSGLVVERLQLGAPDGKRALKGRKVSVHYIGKLQKTGKQFDSNIGRKPLRFRLGVGQVIKGWDVGIQGMRVGDKRRLTVPPSMGYGRKGLPPQIPPNAWLVFDVDLVNAAAR